ncbi:hypothetical protein N4562_08690 [Ligilactobacillus agilis]|uniref:Bacteriocin-associated integral membrane protein n=1 Tax=Ligilactobacillus agilis TaxID=1601 RepID=A0A9Q9J475_9LACO|nr:hypothetical protein [Ligilactobacillus agilis]MCL8204136.1 hypothetical protein [Ligilactobacillus agilis]UXC63116.1 hypothetical protein N4562_08690 [Ligilactobacillus agilis]UXC65115.1 hypothetical protein N4597_08685 [Ligilactobacillus agilis]
MSAKKWLLGLIVLMSMLTGLTSFYLNQYQQQVQLATQQQDLSKHFTALRLPADLLINSATKQRLIFSALNKSASKYHLNYLEKCADVGYSYDWLGLKPTSNYHNHYTFYVHHLATSMITGNFGDLGTQKDYYRYTYPYLKGYQVTLKPLNEAKPLRAQYEGIYFVETRNQARYDAFLADFNQQINRKFKKHYASGDYQPRDEEQLLIPHFYFSDTLASINDYLLLFSLLALVIYYFLEQASVKLYKLNGYSLPLTVITVMKVPGLLLTVTTGLSLTVLLVAGGVAESFIVLNIFFWQLLVSLGTITVLYIVSLDELKEKLLEIGSFLGLFSLKFLVVALSFVSLFNIAEATISGFKSVQVNQVKKDYLCFYPLQVGRNPVGDVDNYLRGGKRLYYLAAKEKILYIDSGAASYKQPADVARAKTSVTMNNYYLDAYPLKDIHGHKITVKPSENRLVILLPKDRRNQERAALTYIKKYVQASNKPLKVIYTDPKYNQSSYDALNQRAMDDEIVYVVTSKSLTTYLNILNGSPRDGLMIPLEGSEKALRQKWLKRMKEVNLEDNFPQLIRYSQADRAEFRQELTDLGEHVVENLFYLLTLILLSGYSLGSYLKLFAREIRLKRSYGYSRFKAYQSYWLLLLGQYLCIGTYGIVRVIQGADGLNLLVVLAIISLIELAVTGLALRKVEAEND